MDTTKYAKIATLVIAPLLIILSLFDINLHSVGVATGDSIGHYVTYHFFHANIFHALVNSWCLLGIAFYQELTIRRLLIAFLFATLLPSCTVSETPTVGLSAVCFTLLGMSTFQVSNVRKYVGYMAFYIIVGILLPMVNGWVHLYGFAIGSLYSYVVKCRRK